MVAKLTISQKNQLVGQLFDEDSYFNPIQDIDNNWVISIEEIEQCVNLYFQWVKTLPLIEFKPKPNIIIP